MRRTHGQTHVLDDVDRQLVDILHRDPRASNRSMARAVGVTDETVAARLRRMFEVGAMAMTVVCDWEAIGYPIYALGRGRLGATTVEQLLAGFGDRREVYAVSETTGAADVVLNLLARDLPSLHELVASDLRGLDGLQSLHVDLVTEVCKQSLGISTLPIPAWSSTEFPDPVLALDDLDHAMLALLATDAHESNREIARRLGVSDGTVRARLARLVDGGLARIVAMVDPVTTGDVGAVALAFFTVDGHPDALIERLVGDEAVPTVYRCVGSCDVAAIIDGETIADIHQKLGRDLKLAPGVRGVDVATVVEVSLHRAHLSRLL